MKIGIFAVACAMALTGCASGYAKFYTPMPGADPSVVASRRVAPAPGTPAVERWDGTTDDLYPHFAQLGYAPIGYSSYNGASGNESDAVAQGRKVQADLVVIIPPRYTGTRSTVLPIVTPTTNTSTTSGTATAYGSGGYATAYGTATTTTYGTQTNFVPINTDRYDYGAVYMVKLKSTFGVYSRDLNDQERQSLGSNRGVVVLTVVNNTPAFNADILPGDIITSLNGERVSQDLIQKRIHENAGKTITVSIHRASGDLDKTVTLNN